jgi:hypothetical protein
MGRTKTPGAEMELAKRQHPVVMLHNAGYSYRRIAELTGMSKSTCQRTYREVLAETRGVKDIERHRNEVFLDIEMTLETLRPFVLQLPAPDDVDPMLSPKELHDAWWRTLKAKREFLGLDAPRETQMIISNDDVVNDEAAEFLADLAVWMRRTGALEVRPVLPPGMTERVDPSTNGHAHTNGHVYGKSMWSMVVDFPRDPADDPDVE